MYLTWSLEYIPLSGLNCADYCKSFPTFNMPIPTPGQMASWLALGSKRACKPVNPYSNTPMSRASTTGDSLPINEEICLLGTYYRHFAPISHLGLLCARCQANMAREFRPSFPGELADARASDLHAAHARACMLITRNRQRVFFFFSPFSLSPAQLPSPAASAVNLDQDV